MSRRSFAILAAAAVAWSSAILAQGPAPTQGPAAVAPPANRWTAAQIGDAFQLADANGDGQLNRAEAQRLPLLPRTFEETDLNKDGALTLEEYTASFSSA